MGKVADRIRAEEAAKGQKKIERRNIFDRVADDQAEQEAVAQRTRRSGSIFDRSNGGKPQEKKS